LDRVMLNQQDIRVSDNYEIKHSSASIDNDAMSFLLYSDKPGDHRLVALYFYRWTKPAAHAPTPGVELKSATPTAPQVGQATPAVQTPSVELETPFNFIYGQAYQVAWRNDRKFIVTLCGAPIKDMTTSFQDAFSSWKAALKGAADFDKSDDLKETCKPFSDLQSHTFTYVDDYDGRAFSQTISIPNFSAGQILDSDVFVYLSELQKTIPKGINVHDSRAFLEKGVQQEFDLSAVRELGHFLGLGLADKSTNSVMTQDLSTQPMVTSWDSDALQVLYRNDNPVSRFLNGF
jgi:hypothetical protein